MPEALYPAPEGLVKGNKTVSNTLFSLRLVILACIGLSAVASRLFAVIRFESIIHEFDPWFNFRATKVLTEKGFAQFWNWFDATAWYPLGRVAGGTLYPGLMITSGVIHNVLHAINIPVDIREICVMLAPAFSGLTSIAAYLLAKEIGAKADGTGGEGAGLWAALFMGVAPGYISRSVAGSYDNEAIAIFILCFTFYLWLKALKLGSALYGALTALFYFYMVGAWGGYAFITNMLPLHCFALLIMGRFSSRIYVAYSTYYAIGTLASMNVPFVGFQPIRTSEHMSALGVFGLLQLVAFVQLVRSHLPQKQFRYVLSVSLAAAIVFGSAAVVLLTKKGWIAPWTGRFYSLWDTGYAKIHIPIIASVSEHQPTAWPSFFFDLNLLIYLFPAGIYLCFRELRDEHVFVIVYSIVGSYFAGVMVRLMLTLTPVVCISGAVVVARYFETFIDPYAPVHSAPSPVEKQAETIEEDELLNSSPAKKQKKKTTSTPVEATSKPSTLLSPDKYSASSFGVHGLDTRVFAILTLVFFLVTFCLHCTYVTSTAYSSPSVVLASKNPDGSQNIIDDFREAYYWLRQNTEKDAKVMSWWDYGYQLAGFADRTTLVDNATWNNTHIATVGKAMSSREEVSYPILRAHDVDYVMIVFGGLIGYSGDDINKFLWMIRIAEGIWPDEVKEANYFNRGEYRIDDGATATMKNSLMYKMSYHRFNDLFQGQGVDRVRNQKVPVPGPTLDTLDEAFTSENWLVRIYQVRKPDVLGRPLPSANAFVGGKKKKRSKLGASAAPIRRVSV